jgi:hypothetical protein
LGCCSVGKNYDGALESFNAALSLNPMLMDVFTHIMMVHGAKGEVETRAGQV